MTSQAGHAKPEKWNLYHEHFYQVKIGRVEKWIIYPQVVNNLLSFGSDFFKLTVQVVDHEVLHELYAWYFSSEIQTRMRTMG